MTGAITAAIVSLSLLSPDPVDLNAADEWTLEAVHGISRTQAGEIVRYRQKYGPFILLEDLEFVPGIGPATLDAIRDLVMVGDTDGAVSDTTHWMPVTDSLVPLLIVSFLDVGQGDAILIEAAGGETWLFDGGPDPGGPLQPPVVHRLLEMGVDTVDVLAFSHPHADHIGALPSVLRSFPVVQVLDPGMEHSSPVYEDLLEEVLLQGCGYSLMLEGAVRYLSPQVTAEVVSLGGSDADLDLNENSALLMVRCNQFCVLLTGDMEDASERALAPGAEPVTVLKVPHHGSISSLFPPYLRRVRPQFAVISAGRDNPFGHPHPAAIEAYTELGAEILRTDTGGTIVVETDGRTVRLTRTFPSPGY